VLDSFREDRTELVALTVDRLVADNHAPFKPQLFDDAQAELETEVPSHCAVDDARRKSMAMVERLQSFHAPTLPAQR
jgi:hypothetical protein